MDVHDRLKVKMEPSTYKANGILAEELEDELMKFTKEDEDRKVNAHMVKQTEEVRRNTDMEVNITECTKSFENELLASEYHDTTESSSSFEENRLEVGIGNSWDDSEVSSEFCDDAASALDFSGFSDKFRFRKKKLTTHWRSFIQPLVWRCKWLQVQMKRLQIQANQYDQELKAYNKQKQIQLENSTQEHGVKSLPFSQSNARRDVMKRKKRRMTEVTTDVAAYMSRHNLFGYYENKKSSEDAFTSNEIKNPANQKANVYNEYLANNELLSAEPGDSDNSMERLLCKIHHLQSQVSKLKDRVDEVVNQNAGRIPCTDILTFAMPCNASPSSNGERMAVGTYIASQLLSEYNMGDALGPESAVTSHGDTHDPNGHVEDGALIDNQRVKDEMNSFEEVKIPPVSRDDPCNSSAKEGIANSDEGTAHSIDGPSGCKDESGNATPPVLTGPDLPTDNQPPPKIRSVAKLTALQGKRKRARRRGGGGGRWSRRSTG